MSLSIAPRGASEAIYLGGSERGWYEPPGPARLAVTNREPSTDRNRQRPFHVPGARQVGGGGRELSGVLWRLPVPCALGVPRQGRAVPAGQGGHEITPYNACSKNSVFALDG